MSKNLLGNNFITQIGILVHDIEKTSQVYADFFGVDKPEAIITDTVDKAQTEYRGESTVARAKLAFFNMGSLQLELIEPDEHPSTWREYLDEHGEGVHHIAFEIEGMKEKVQLLEGAQMPLVQKGEYEGGRYAYIDSVKDLKVMLELLEND
ncbi:VOC family protein [Lederbergia citrea]|uniref:VOC family protein n=1 Tax=Lederbergia citrea TaxID=2833581 RepID=A0A942UNC4_9BACI|nr:VOC family protein [Lederbergia citrea]MBS4179287.1 VOC family protein [Lederbergia citrea]MBS4205950.1 VOC family protein [Lederbergia citrea]MBS4224601.1 VOC family protein [Lederbergia citrea]